MRLSRFTVSRMERHLSRGFYVVVERAGRQCRRPRGRVAYRVSGDPGARGSGRADSGAVGRADPPAHRGFVPLHDRGRVLTDTAVAIADGATTIAGIDTLRHQGELFSAGGGRQPPAAGTPNAILGP